MKEQFFLCFFTCKVEREFVKREAAADKFFGSFSKAWSANRKSLSEAPTRKSFKKKKQNWKEFLCSFCFVLFLFCFLSFVILSLKSNGPVPFRFILYFFSLAFFFCFFCCVKVLFPLTCIAPLPLRFASLLSFFSPSSLLSVLLFFLLLLLLSYQLLSITEQLSYVYPKQSRSCFHWPVLVLFLFVSVPSLFLFTLSYLLLSREEQLLYKFPKQCQDLVSIDPKYYSIEIESIFQCFFLMATKFLRGEKLKSEQEKKLCCFVSFFSKISVSRRLSCFSYLLFLFSFFSVLSHVFLFFFFFVEKVSFALYCKRKGFSLFVLCFSRLIWKKKNNILILPNLIVPTKHSLFFCQEKEKVCTWFYPIFDMFRRSSDCWFCLTNCDAAYWGG